MSVIDRRSGRPDAVVPRPAPGAGPAHLAALDGVRAVAIAMVIALHVSESTAMASEDGLVWRTVNQGRVGVPIFFVLSGLLLYRPWAAQTLRGGPAPSVRVYLWRRGLRILPAYWLMLAVVFALFSRSHLTSPRAWLEWLTLTQHYDPRPWWKGVGPPGLSPIWSLAVEAAFYLCLPVLAAGLRRFAQRGGVTDVDVRARRLLWGIGALTLFSAAVTTVVRVFGDYGTLFYWEHLLPRSLMYFAAGMALAVAVRWASLRPGTPVARRVETCGAVPGVWWTAALCLMVLAATQISTPSAGLAQNAGQYLVSAALYLLIGAAVVLPAAFAPGDRITMAALGNPVVRRIGLVSYGVFLWHMAVIEGWNRYTGRPIFHHDFWTVFPAVTALSLLIATVSYLALERPAQHLRDRVRPRSRPADHPRQPLPPEPRSGPALRSGIAPRPEGPYEPEGAPHPEGAHGRPHEAPRRAPEDVQVASRPPSRPRRRR
ncbi:acyltransferase family protein [Actinomadura parmotrematis]|uniref:Acyltransferase n=1 Tax=Actinomadura parmotrematis TaxID=2864039 RepID=A0ABS7G4C5_9ACTN|nr:acyltransferase [Actinomadura parmotrematis]MBW8487564.1 acyltransferase [Actinomadura parmotrematis]